MFEDFLAIRRLLTPEQKKHLPEVKPPFKGDSQRPNFAGPGGQVRTPPGGPQDFGGPSGPDAHGRSKGDEL
jgi:hypothetical protein